MNFTFLSPAFLWALPLALGPLILHWLSRAKPRPRVFPSLELVRAALKSQIYRSRLQNILLLIARCLLLAALALLFSRPMMHWRRGGASPDQQLSLLFLLDVSYSMDARSAGASALDRARQEALAFIDRAGPGDRLGLVAFSDKVEMTLPPSSDFEKLRGALQNLKTTWRPTRVAPALEVASQMLAGDQQGQKAVVVLSDLARNGWAEILSPPRFPAGTRVLLKEAGPAMSNAGVTGLRLLEGRAEALEGSFTAQAWETSGPRAWRVSLRQNTVAQGSLTLPAGGQTASAVFRAAGKGAGLAAGEVSLAPDVLAADDKFFFLWQRPPVFSVLVVSGAPGLSPVQDESFYLMSALEELSQRGVTARKIFQEDLLKQDLAAWDVVALLNPMPLNQQAAALLSAHVKKGGGLLVTAGDNLEKSAASLAPLLPVRLLSASRSREALRLSDAAQNRDVGRALSEQNGFEWGRVTLNQRQEVEPLPGAWPLLVTGESGRPVLVLRRADAGPTAFLATSVDRDWTNLPAKPAFPVLCREILLWLAGRQGNTGRAALTVDQPFEWTFPDPLLVAVTVERPDGFTEEAPVRAGRLRYDKTQDPGVYAIRARASQEPVAWFAVNVNAENGEGDPARVSEERLGELFPDIEWAWVPAEQPAVEVFNERLRGKDMAPLLAALVLSFLIMEILFSLPWRRRETPSHALAGEAG